MSEAERYDQEQQRLQAERDGDIRIDPPQEMPEVNPELIRDVEPLLFRGFVYAPAVINDVPFVFKSLNHHEFELMGFMVGESNTRKGLRKHYNYFLAHGVFMIDGVNVLSRRSDWLPNIAAMFGEMNEGARRRVIRELSEVNRRASRATLLSEVYALESVSRIRWAQHKGLDLTSPSVTGVAGTETLGLNWGQLTWRATNYYEDRRDESEREWENVKFIASATAGKEIQKVHNKDKQRREQERSERMDRRDRILRFAILGEPFAHEDSDKPQVHVARTVDELATQLERDLRGEKDFHDEVVDAYERRVQAEYQQRQQLLQQYRERFDQEYGGRPSVGSTDFAGLTPDQVKQRITQRQAELAKRLSQPTQFPELRNPKISEFMDKWGPNRPLASSPAEKPRFLPIKRGDE